jgi:hypothetical protein
MTARVSRQVLTRAEDRPVTGQEWLDDPGLVLDEEFVARARHREASGRERAHRAARIAEAHRSAGPWRAGAGDTVRVGGRAARRDRRGRTALVLGAVVLAGGWVSGLLPGLVGPGAVGVGGALLQGASGPAPGEEPASAQRLLPAPPLPAAGGGGFAFLQTGPDGRSPLGWDPCRPVRWVTRPAAQPPDGAALLAGAMGEVGVATGLLLVDAGVTEEGPSDGREAYQPHRYGRGWAPVLVVWSDPGESPQLAGDVAGYAGPVSYGRAGQQERYVSGQVVLDAPQLATLQTTPGGADAVRAVVLHELAHLVGLAHVPDPSQLMNPAGSAAVTGFAEGDRHGLALLGAGGCR